MRASAKTVDVCGWVCAQGGGISVIYIISCNPCAGCAGRGGLLRLCSSRHLLIPVSPSTINVKKTTTTTTTTTISAPRYVTRTSRRVPGAAIYQLSGGGDTINISSHIFIYVRIVQVILWYLCIPYIIALTSRGTSWYQPGSESTSWYQPEIPVPAWTPPVQLKHISPPRSTNSNPTTTKPTTQRTNDTKNDCSRNSS